MDKFAHDLKHDPIDLLYEVEVLGRKIKTQEEIESIEASYFAMSLLVPDESFMAIINTKEGGLSDWTSKSSINILSRIFKVEPRLIAIKIVGLNKKINEQNHQKVQGNDISQGKRTK